MTLKTIKVSCDNIVYERFSLASFHKCQHKFITSSNFYSFDRLVNVLTSFRIGIAVSGLMLRLKAKEFSDDPEFKASLGLYQQWKRYYSVSLRIKTTLAQRLPEDLEQQTLTFHRFVITSRQRHGYSLSRIFNMDETPMRFELPSSRTLEFSNDCILCFFTLDRLISKYIPI